MTGGETKGLTLLRVDQALEDRAKPDAPIAVHPASGLASIVVPCFGQVEHTRICVTSLLRHARDPFELVFIDMASIDGTADYLAGLRTASRVRVTIVTVRDDVNISAACDAGIAHARGRFVALLANDTIVTPGWLEQSIALAAHAPDIGAVGPMSNHASPPQYSGPVPYRLGSDAIRLLAEPPSAPPTEPMEAIDQFANQWRRDHEGKWLEVERLDPFCVVFKREALDRIGSLGALAAQSGARSKMQPFDPDLLGQRLRRAGFRLACCHDLFIHHFGTQTPMSV